ncbi:helix-turn-helix domain-containing protein [Georgenia sp. Z1344]|uniref:helix-turn-helix domain-containing protein n=1 Tax=Georgenia sp. Z1344 TaxID=3416706 RepID=UPI003CED0A6B
MTGQRPVWEFVHAPPRSVPGAVTAVGYRAHGAPETVHRGLPSAGLTFIIALDDGVRAAASSEELAATRPTRILLGGLHRTASLVDQRSDQAGVQLALHPLAARSVLGVPAAELSVTDFDGTSLVGAWGDELAGRAAEANGWREVFAHLVGALARRYDDRAAVRPELAHAWHLLQRTGGRIPVRRLAGEVGLSERHLSTLFRREIGAGPKAVGGLMRFERVVAAISAQVREGGTDLARAAAETGYADQAHLTREFTRHAGIPPTAWIDEERRNIQAGGHGGTAASDHERQRAGHHDHHRPGRLDHAPGT